MLLKKVKARKIYDSRKGPTIEVSVNGQKASSPSGKSKGKYETPSFHKSLEWNVQFLNSIIFNLEINSFQDIKKLESFIKKKLKFKDIKQFGANALFALESSVLKALAKSQNKQLWQIINPQAEKLSDPVGNAIGGGLHSHNNGSPVFQEFLIIPLKTQQKIKVMNEVYSRIGKILNTKGKNDEGAWQVDLNNEQVLEVLSKFKDIRIGIDVAASALYKKGNYYYKNKNLNKTAQIHYINSLIKKYNIYYLEDPLQEEDFTGFRKIIKKNLVVGDDLTATQISRVRRAIKNKSINAMIVKPNQNGSLLELKKIFEICKKHKIKTILSHRSGETLDNALADLAVGFQADFIKCGISTKWRESKLKRLIEIEKSVIN